jgi:hypothetical protein
MFMGRNVPPTREPVLAPTVSKQLSPAATAAAAAAAAAAEEDKLRGVHQQLAVIALEGDNKQQELRAVDTHRETVPAFKVRGLDRSSVFVVIEAEGAFIVNICKHLQNII